MGRVDGCFANAGIGGGGAKSFLEMSSELWQPACLRVNLDGAFYTFRAAARHMVERGGDGVLVGTASLAAIEGVASQRALRRNQRRIDLDGAQSRGGVRATQCARRACDPAGDGSRPT